MKRIPIRESGLVGTLLQPENPKSAVICIGGSSGGLKEEHAEKLAKEGFAGVALAYFGFESLPQKLDQIPLEYFRSAIDWTLKKLGLEKVALWGGSRGAEVALIIGTLFPDKICAIAAHVPSSVVFGTLDGKEGVAWTFKNQPMPSAPFQYTQSNMGESEANPIRPTSCFLKAMKDQKAFSLSAIPVEKLSCPLLLISAKDDQMWPSDVFANQIVERLKDHNSKITCSHLSYEAVGHAPARGEIGFHPGLKRWFAFGGTPEANQKAAHEWTKKTIEFFKEYLS